MKKFFFLFVVLIAGYVSPAHAIPKDVVDRAQAVFTEQLSLDYCTSDEHLNWVAKDAVYQYRLNVIDVKLRVEGSRAVAAHLCALSELAPAAVAENIRYYPTLNQETLFVQYDLVPFDVAATRINTLAIIEMSGNQITSFTLLNRSPESFEVLQAATGGEN